MSRLSVYVSGVLNVGLGIRKIGSGMLNIGSGMLNVGSAISSTSVRGSMRGRGRDCEPCVAQSRGHHVDSRRAYCLGLGKSGVVRSAGDNFL